MIVRTLVVFTTLLALSGAAYAKKTTFNSVPANIADAPVADDFLRVERRDDTHIYRWNVHMPDGNIWISQTWAGRYWPEAYYSSESHVLGRFEKNGFSNFRQVKSTAYAGSQWGYMAIARYKRGRTCVVGIVLDNDNYDHDGPWGGTLLGYVADCGSGAEGRYDEWRTWFRSFKRVPLGYNAHLDR